MADKPVGFYSPRQPPGPCAVEHCNGRAETRGWCDKHYKRWKTHGDPLTMMIAEKGTGHITTKGYKVVQRPGHPNAGSGGHIPEHRLVMSDLLGRPLAKDENVHHVNGDRLDNRPANLELWNTSQPYGQRVEDKVAWAREILTRYGNDFVQPRLALVEF